MADVNVQRLQDLEVVCIETFKVYDFCFQSERRENNCFPLEDFVRSNSVRAKEDYEEPAVEESDVELAAVNEERWECPTPKPKKCPIDADEIVSASCVIKKVKCVELARSEPDETGRAQVTLGITVKATATITDDRDNTCTQDGEFGFTKTILLCAPEGTEINCFIPTFSCGPCILTGNQVCCTFDLCVIVQSFALVKLLVPSFGFCTPDVCEQVSPEPPFVCPPELFPPQCNNNNDC